MADADTETGGGEGHNFLMYDGPKPGIRYPLKVPYCGGKCNLSSFLFAD